MVHIVELISYLITNAFEATYVISHCSIKSFVLFVYRFLTVTLIICSTFKICIHFEINIFIQFAIFILNLYSYLIIWPISISNKKLNNMFKTVLTTYSKNIF